VASPPVEDDRDARGGDAMTDGGRGRPRRRWGRRILSALLGIAAVLGIAAGVTSDRFRSFGASTPHAALAAAAKASHFSDGKFWNDEPTGVMKKGPGAWLKGTLFGHEMRSPSCALPMAPDGAARLRVAPASGLRVTWLGHSTSLIEIDGARILTDPVWSERASPSTLVGPKRFHPPPLSLEDLPPLDAVVVSHDHYDHLDMTTMRALAARGAVIHVPLGLGAHLRLWGVPPAQIVEHDWWQAVRLPGGVDVVSTPARHFSGRGLLDRDHTLWTSWSLIGPRHRVFFSGDTGLTAGHARIGDRFGPFDLAMIEIGQYHPSWGDIHLGPMGALQAFARLRAAKLLPIHWATFQLGLHAWSEPAETLTVEAARRGVAVLTPRLGEPIEPTTNPRTGPWWRALPPTASACPPP
jgi:L-ascorbate metabolism protein UlaG (beta-lactamase superfamily)